MPIDIDFLEKVFGDKNLGKDVIFLKDAPAIISVAIDREVPYCNSIVWITISISSHCDRGMVSLGEVWDFINDEKSDGEYQLIEQDKSVPYAHRYCLKVLKAPTSGKIEKFAELIIRKK